MKTIYLVSPFLCGVAFASAVTDLRNLTDLITSSSSSMLASLSTPNSNSSATTGIANGFVVIGKDYPTDSTISKVSDKILSIKDSLDYDQNAYVDGQTVDTINAAYLQYINSIPTFAQAVVARGRAFHSEWNLPVYSSLETFSNDVNSLGFDLADRNLINQNAIVSTLTAESTILDAQSSWSSSGSSPGNLRRSMSKRIKF